MVKKMRKPLALFLALVMCLGMVNFTALANETADHEHNADGWTCTQAEPVKTLNCEEDHEHGDECYTVTEGEWTCVAPVVEETPAEVTAFLSAVAGIPAITAENAAEVAEYVYGPVSEAYEALLGTEYEERADVQEAVAAYAAAIDAVDAALDMESGTFEAQLIQGQFDDVTGSTIAIRPNRVPADYTGTVQYQYRGFNIYGDPTNNIYVGTSNINRIGASAPSNYAGSVEKMVGEQGIFQRCPHNTFVGSNCGHTIGQPFAPMGYCDIKVNLSEADIVDNISYGIGSFDRQMANAAGVSNLAGAECLKVTYDANRPGRTTFTQTYYVNFLTSVLGGYCGCGEITANQTNFSWHQYTDSFNVNVYAYYTVNFLPGGDNVTNMPSNVTNSKQFTDSYTVTTQQPQREGYTFKGWVDDKGNNVGTTAIAKWYEGDGAYVTRTLTAVWEEAKTYTVTYTDGVPGKTVFPDQGYEGRKEGDATPKFEGGAPTSYTDDAGNTYTFQGWNPAVNSVVSADDADANGEIIYTATWKKDEAPTAPTEEEAAGILNGKYTVTVKCTNEARTHTLASKNYNITAADITSIGTVTKNTATDKWEVEVTSANQKFVDKFEAEANVNCAHDDVSGGFGIKLTWDGTDWTYDGTYTREIETECHPAVETTYKLKYDANGGQFGSVSTQTTWLAEANSFDATYTFTVEDPSQNTNFAPNKTNCTLLGWADTADGEVQYNAGEEITLTKDAPTKTIYAVWKEPTLALEVNKTNGGFEMNDDDDGASVNYTVTVTNKSDIDLYGLKLTDVMTVSPAASDDGVTYTFRDWKVGENDAVIISGEPTDLTHTLWVVDRNTLFAKNTSVTLTYTVDIVNNGDDDVEVKLDNEAKGESWKAPKTTTYKVRSLIMPLTDDDPSDVSGTGTSSAGGSTGGSSTGGTLSGKKYTVTYSWNLPAGADETKPADAKYKKGEQVAVDTEYTNGSTVTVDGKVYTFSGWDKSDFTMPAQNVTITGTWTHTHVWNKKTDGNDHTVWADGKAPDCIHDGTAIYECACGETKEEVETGSALGHDFTNAIAKDNCTSGHDDACTGHTYTCVRCNGTLKDGHETKTEAHTYGDWIEDTAATMTTTGTKHRVCSACGHIENVIIPDPEYKVTVDPANGEDKTETTVKKNDEFTVPAAPTAPEGKEFDGWKGSDGKDYKPGDKITVTGDLTLTAQWKDKTYTVTFNSNGGSAVEGQTVKHGDKATRPADPTRDGYTFNGWTLNGQPYDFTTPVTGNITLVAQWTQNTRPVDPDPDYTYTLNYNANGGVGAPASQSQINSRNFTVSAVEPTREGYTFAGWATTAGAETAAYQPGSQLRINNGFSLTLFAVWTPEEDVNETEPPLVETPDVTETPDEGEDLGDNDTPLTELPDETEPPVEPTETPDETEDLDEGDTPLAEVPQTGDSIGLWIVLTLCSAAGLYCFFPKKKKGQREA